jgi:hypothetical protein
MTADEAYAAVERAFAGQPSVSRSTKRGFAEGGLMTSGKLFAVRRPGDLLLKLPAERVAALIASGEAAPFSSGGRVMREWALAKPEAADAWLALAREAQTFVAAIEAERNG